MPLVGVSFSDANNGTVVGSSGIISEQQTVEQPGLLKQVGHHISLYSVSFTDANNGTAVGDFGTILRTTNGGTNWTSQSSGTTNNLYGVSFTDANNGTAVGSLVQFSEPQTVEQTGYHNQAEQQYVKWCFLLLIQIMGRLLVGTGTILRTTNGGINWTSQSSGTTY